MFEAFGLMGWLPALNGQKSLLFQLQRVYIPCSRPEEFFITGPSRKKHGNCDVLGALVLLHRWKHSDYVKSSS